MTDQETLSLARMKARLALLDDLIDIAEDKGWPCGTLKKEWRAIKKQLDKDKNP